MSFFNYLQENNLLSQIAGDSIYIYPNIPQKKLVNAVNTYGNDLIKDFSEVKILIDDTVFGSAKDGMFITENDKLYFKMFGSDGGFVDIYELSKIRIKQSKLVLDIYDEDESEEKLFHLSYDGKKEKLALFSFLNQYISNLGVIEPSNEIISESYEINELNLDKETKRLLNELKGNIIEMTKIICAYYPVLKFMYNEKNILGFDGYHNNKEKGYENLGEYFGISILSLNQFIKCLKIYFKLQNRFENVDVLVEDFRNLFQNKMAFFGDFIDFCSGKEGTFLYMTYGGGLIEGGLLKEYKDGFDKRIDQLLLEKDEVKIRIIPNLSRWKNLPNYRVLNDIIERLEDALHIFYPRQYILYNEGLIIGELFSSKSEVVDWVINLWHAARNMAYEIYNLNGLIEDSKKYDCKDLEFEVYYDSLLDYVKQSYQYYFDFLVEFSDLFSGEENVYLIGSKLFEDNVDDLLEKAEEKVRENIERNYDKLSAIMVPDPKFWFNFEDDDLEDNEEEEIESQVLGNQKNVNSVKKEDKSSNSTLINFLGNNINKVADVLSKNGIPLTTAVLNNDQMILKIAGVIYNILPTPVRFVLSLETVERFLLENRTWLVQKLTK